jgi:hypothetical protein
VTPDEELELRASVGYAAERHGTPQFRPAIAPISEWHDRRYIRAYERREPATAGVLQVMRATNPARRREAAA